jgi:hypothetical protein
MPGALYSQNRGWDGKIYLSVTLQEVPSVTAEKEKQKDILHPTGAD